MTEHTAELAHHSPEEIRKHVRAYVLVFVALAILTVITVAVNALEIPRWAAIAVALAIASVKGGLVMSYFMHLLTEKALIFYTLILTAVFFLFLLLLPLWTDMEMVLIS